MSAPGCALSEGPLTTLPLPAVAELAAAVVTGVVGLLLLAGSQRRVPHLAIAAFLLLLAANQGAEVVRTMAYAEGDLARAAVAYRVASVVAALDPVALLYFASVYPARNALNRPAVVGVALAAGAALAGLAVVVPVVPPFGSSLPLETGLSLFTAVAYTAFFVHAARGVLDSGTAGVPGLLFPAACFAVVPVWSRAFIGVWAYLPPRFPTPHDHLAAGLGLALALALPAGVALLLLARAHRSREGPPGRWPFLRNLVLAAVAFTLLSRLQTVVRTIQVLAGLPLDMPVPTSFVSFAVPLRWLVFTTFVSMAVLRHEMLGLSLQWRRRAARVLVAVAFLGAGAAAIAAVEVALGWPVALSPVEGALLAAVVVASQRFQGGVDRVAERVYGVPMPGDAAASLEAYRRGLAQAVDEGRGLDDPRLARLEAELALDPRAAGVLRRMAEDAAAAPQAEGALVAGRYRVLRLLARGGSGGRAFLARDEVLARSAVLKEIPHDDAAAEAAALREARIAGSLQHPHVVTVFDIVQRPRASLLVTEHLPGGDLATRLARGPLEPGEAVRVVDHVLAGLEAVHAHGVVHRDVKPENVMLGPDGAAKIGDFGIALARRAQTVKGYRPPAFAGTPGFMAPEQARGEATERSDVYAAGRLLQRCAPRLPAPVAAVAARAVRSDPSRRWGTARAMREALRAAAAEAGLSGGT